MVTAIKDIIRDATGLPDEVLHLLIGLVVFFAAALVLRKALSSWWPFLVVAALQGINELADMAGDYARWGDIQVRGTVWDTVLTLAIPFLVTMILRLTGQGRRRAAERGASGDQS